MKEFNLERALAGDPVVTRQNVPVTEIIKVGTVKSPYKILAVINGEAVFFTMKGEFTEGASDSWDLFMAPVKKQEWVNIYKDADTMSGYHVGDLTFSTKEQAETCNATATYVASVLIREWEE